MRTISRRALLKGAAATGAIGATGALTRVADAAVPQDLDVAVIGGGVSGAYVAWSALTRDPDGLRLQAGGRPKVALFELSDRIGGRLWSAAPPDAPHLHAEIGGMRYLKRQHLISALIDHLKIANRPFPFGGPNNLHYMRGKRFTVADVEARRPVVPYALSAPYQGLTPGDAFLKAIERVVPNAAKMTPAQWLAAKKTLKIGGRPFHDLGMDELVDIVLSGDDKDYVVDGNGYLADFSRINAADNAQGLFADFYQPVYRTPVDGFHAVPRTLARAFEQAGGHVQRNARLTRVDRVREGGKDLLVLRFQGATGPFTVRARHVVLAMPWRSLHLLDKASFMFADKGFVADVEAVTPVAALKLFLAYDRPWWGDVGIEHGRSVTDMHLRQCVYFGTERTALNGQAGNDRSLIKATYSDHRAVGYWKRFQSRSPAPYPSRGVVPAGLECSAAAVAAVQSELSLLHGVPAPAPDWAILQDWTKDPFGGGWHAWKPGAKSWEVMPRIRRPVAGAPLYLCGEAYSDAQGWVEGALQTAEHVLQDHLGLGRPSWLPADANIGP